MIASLWGSFREPEEYGNLFTTEHGVGYELNIASQKVETGGHEIFVFIHHHISESGQALYAFATNDEKMFFRDLISVSGVGCSTAQNIMLNADIDHLRWAIGAGDIAMIKKIKGIGEKGAKQIILALQNKYKESIVIESKGVDPGNLFDKDAISALVSLGKSKSDATARVNAIADKSLSLPNLISAALQ